MSNPPLPWWWLSAAECTALGLGEGARRTERGVVFGDPSRIRLEIVARAEDGAVKLGSIALRLWGPTDTPAARRVLVLTARLLHARRDLGFDPAAIPLEAPPQAATSKSATPTIIDLPSVCERACVFCGISTVPRAERRPRGRDEDVVKAIEAAPGSVIFTGDDALESPRVVEWVRRASARGAEVAIIGPPRVGRTRSLAPALAEAGLGRYLTAIFGDSPEAHDPVAGLPGAFSALEETAAAMRAVKVHVELVTPLVTPILASLPAVIARARALVGAPPTLLVYAPDTAVGTGFDSMVPGFDLLRSALVKLFAGEGPHPGFDALPLCVLPEALRRDAAARLSRTDQKLSAVYPPGPCDGCELREACPGIATTVLRAVGSAGLVKLRRGPG